MFESNNMDAQRNYVRNLELQIVLVVNCDT
jgi:hypothetical protein